MIIGLQCYITFSFLSNLVCQPQEGIKILSLSHIILTTRWNCAKSVLDRTCWVIFYYTEFTRFFILQVLEMVVLITVKVFYYKHIGWMYVIKKQLIEEANGRQMTSKETVVNSFHWIIIKVYHVQRKLLLYISSHLNNLSKWMYCK